MRVSPAQRSASWARLPGVRAYVGVTDGDWYRFLAPGPGSRRSTSGGPAAAGEFRALGPGEPFFFKTHHPHNRVVGGGFYSGFARLRVSEAWELFGEGNGVADLTQMRRGSANTAGSRSRRARTRSSAACSSATSASSRRRRAGAAAGLRTQHRAGQGLRPGRPSLAAGYFEDLLHRLLGVRGRGRPSASRGTATGPVFGDPRLAPHAARPAGVPGGRPGRLRPALRDHRHQIRPVLQAAHIRPLPAGGEHRLDNGLLLRSDVHTLFDRGYLGVDPKHRLLVSPRLREEFGNGEQFYARAGQPIALPERRADRAGREFLEWHLDEVFQAT